MVEPAPRNRRGSRLECPVPIRVLPRQELDALAARVVTGASYLLDDAIAAVAAIVWRDAGRLCHHARMRHHIEDVFAVGIVGASNGFAKYQKGEGCAASTYVTSRAWWLMVKRVSALVEESKREHTSSAPDRPSRAPSPAKTVLDKFAVEELLQKLTPNERYVLTARYMEGRSFAEIGRALGMSREGVRQIDEGAKESIQRERFRNILKRQD